MKELDLLEKNILKAIEMSSVFTIGTVTSVYRIVESFDLTITVLKQAISGRVDPIDLAYNARKYAMRPDLEAMKNGLLFPKKNP